jgi:crotonobetainyl-CoA:carnitine CoA-transferase CaiB-like acyl-CoA transferase
MALPLHKIRVLDLSRVLAGPWAGQTLADLGADVIKVERPGVGDDTRSWGPPFVETVSSGAEESRGDAAYYLCANRGKRSIEVDFTRPEGQRIVRDLAARSDVLIENFKVDGLARFGLDYASLREINPALIYCSITGFGQTGPCRELPGYDFLIQGMGGLMSVTGEADSAPGGKPVKVGVAVADVFTGLYAVIAIQAALAHCAETGEGQHIDLALLDVQVATLANQASNFLVSGRPPGRMGNAHPNIVPYEAFKTSDGHIILAVGNDRQFARFCGVADCAELANDPRFAVNSRRVEHREALVPIIAERMRARSSTDWLGALEAAGVPCGPINDIGAVFEDPQVQARGLRVDIPVSSPGAPSREGPGPTLPSVASPMRFSRTPLRHDRAPPRLGEHTDEVMRSELGMTDGEIESARAAGVLGG